jgi:predicted transcriptional regulator
MEVCLTPETEAKLKQLAADRELTPESLIREAVEHFIDYNAWFIREVEKGLAQIETGEVLEHEEVGARLNSLITQKQQPT